MLLCRGHAARAAARHGCAPRSPFRPWPSAAYASASSSPPLPSENNTVRNLALVVWTALCGAAGAKFALSRRDDDAPSPRRRPRLPGAAAEPERPLPPEVVYDAAIVGGGVVGLAVARELAVTFPERRFVLLEKSPDLIAGASSGNSGLGCTGYDAPGGSLERQLLRRSAQRHPNLYRSLGLSYEHARKCGALVVAWDEEQLAQLPEVVEANRAAGDTECRLLSADELLELEPALGNGTGGGSGGGDGGGDGGGGGGKQLPLGAVLVPREVISEPWIVPVAYAESARRNGCDIRPGTEVMALTVLRASEATAVRSAAAGKMLSDSAAGEGHAGSDAAGGGGDDDWFWVLTTRRTPAAPSDAAAVAAAAGATNLQTQQEHLDTVGARVVINCAGLFGDEVEAMRSSAAVHAAREARLSVEEATCIAAAGETAANSATGEEASGAGGGHEHRIFTIHPRKGQFVVFDPPRPAGDGGGSGSDDHHDGGPVLQHIIEPVPSQFTKGVIAWTTLYGQVVVGPTAEEQESRTDRSTTSTVVAALKAHGRLVLGDAFVDAARVAGTYAGIRPATEHRDYQIWSDDAAKWVCVGGIRSTGLTGSSGIAEYVRCLYAHGAFGAKAAAVAAVETTAGCHSGGRVVRGCTCLACTIDDVAVSPPYKPLPAAEVVPPTATSNPSMPTLDELRADFQERGDGCVNIHGTVYRVTHPQCAFGMATQSPVASE